MLLNVKISIKIVVAVGIYKNYSYHNKFVSAYYPFHTMTIKDERIKQKKSYDSIVLYETTPTTNRATRRTMIGPARLEYE